MLRLLVTTSFRYLLFVNLHSFFHGSPGRKKGTKVKPSIFLQNLHTIKEDEKKMIWILAMLNLYVCTSTSLLNLFNKNCIEGTEANRKQ